MTLKYTQFKIEVFIPEKFVTELRQAIANAGAGIIGNYDHCASVTQVRGYWRPIEGAHPYDGTIGKISEGTECKVEVNCPGEAVSGVIKTIREIHPYEEPLINIIPLANNLF